jgi:hypothetical protein
MKRVHGAVVIGLGTAAVAACSPGSSSSAAPVASAPSTSVSASSSPAQPDTKAAAKSTASDFFALYSADQWPQAWALLSPADRAKIPESTFVAQHKACPSAAAGMAYEIKGITMAGKTAVITYTIPAVEKLYGSATQAMSYSAGSGWRIDLDTEAMADYSHGSAKADVAAAKAAGDCSGS